MHFLKDDPLYNTGLKVFFCKCPSNSAFCVLKMLPPVPGLFSKIQFKIYPEDTKVSSNSGLIHEKKD
jgi:hypothetical protein